MKPLRWIVTYFRSRRDWKYGLPDCPVDPTAQAQMDRQRAAGEAAARRQLAPVTPTEPARHAKAKEGRTS